eukprot:TRINITY_DN40920_c0_g1_i1.p1 TRINITY_DN40920_c0_g1~~TRINITY_DN40920_c0_g1_i1.p1  ORF type:complete len:291 (+),score=22.90 TRINITY_DN40920_c0_g1_i1:256-1128(+)
MAVTDHALGVIMPVVIYWAYAGFLDYLDKMDFKVMNKWRLHSRVDEEKLNLVPRSAVIRGVLLQQLLQSIVAVLLFLVDPNSQSHDEPPSLWVQLAQIGVAMVVMDAWQYFWHRLMHESRFLYRHLHSWHHRLLVPYAYGALYNHPLEGLILDTFGGAVSFLVSGMHPRTATVFFTFATMKTVDDHCGLVLPFSPFQRFFKNNAAYHDIHHQLSGFRFNYSQPFFPIWDHLLGTHMPYAVIRRADGGMEARALRPSSLSSDAKATAAAIGPVAVANAAYMASCKKESKLD